MPLPDDAHNDVARMLRNGLAVVGFTALEDFLKSRTSEVLSAVGQTTVPFIELPERLRYAVTFEALTALSYQVSLRSKSDKMQYVQEHAQKIASTALTAYDLSPHALGFDQANLQEETIKTVLKCFLIDDPWGQITAIGSRLGLTALPLNETYKSASQRRHRAAHVANADTPQTDLLQFTKEALAIAIGFDVLLSRALKNIQLHNLRYLQGQSRISAASISIRTVMPENNKWREKIEGRSKAVKIENSLENLLVAAKPRSIAAGNLFIVRDVNFQISKWDCH
jgi:hypothetical protein